MEDHIDLQASVANNQVQTCPIAHADSLAMLSGNDIGAAWRAYWICAEDAVDQLFVLGAQSIKNFAKVFDRLFIQSTVRMWMDDA